MSVPLKPISSFGLENLAKTDSDKIIMSVVVSNDGLSFLYLKDNQEIAFEIFSFTNNFQEIINASALGSKKAAEVHVFFDNRYFVSLPSGVFDEYEKDKIAKMVFGKDNLRILYQKHKHFHIVFGIDKKLFKLVSDQWDNAGFHHFADGFFQNIKGNLNHKEEVFFEIRKGFFWAALFNDKQLQLLNSYEFSAIADFGFFSLGVIKNKGFNPKSLNLRLSGNMEKDSPLFELLSQYIKNIEYLECKEVKKEFHSFQHLINYLKSEN